MIVFRIYIDKENVDLEKVAEAVNKIHRLLVLDLGIDEGMASPVRVSYSIVSRDETQAGEVGA